MFVRRSGPEEVHRRMSENFGTADRPEMIQPTVPWSAALEPPVRPTTKSKTPVGPICLHIYGQIEEGQQGHPEVPTLMEPMICGDG